MALLRLLELGKGLGGRSPWRLHRWRRARHSDCVVERCSVIEFWSDGSGRIAAVGRRAGRGVGAGEGGTRLIRGQSVRPTPVAVELPLLVRRFGAEHGDSLVELCWRTPTKIHWQRASGFQGQKEAGTRPALRAVGEVRVLVWLEQRSHAGRFGYFRISFFWSKK